MILQRNNTENTNDVEFIQTIESSYKEMDVSTNRGTPKWMVYDGKPY